MKTPAIQEHRLLNIEEVSDLLGISKASIYRARSEGNKDMFPPAIKVGVGLRWRLSTVLGWLEDMEGKDEVA